VNASGCVTSARLLDSSGSALLDAAALEWVDVAQLSPAREQGHPAAATAVVLVRFLLGNHANDDGVPAAALPHGAEASGPSVTQLSGIPLGISREQLRDLKGRPLSIQDSAWLYNSLDGAHDGVVTVMFHRSSEAGREIVVGIEYLGDKESAPPELPKLVGAAEPELVRRYGTPRMRELDPGGRRTLVFSNGTYARLHHDKVEAYGIVAVEEAGPLPDVTVFVEPDR
jgi:TonB family protein